MSLSIGIHKENSVLRCHIACVESCVVHQLGGWAKQLPLLQVVQSFVCNVEALSDDAEGVLYVTYQHNSMCQLSVPLLRVRVRATGSGPKKRMPLLSAARQGIKQRAGRSYERSATVCGTVPPMPPSPHQRGDLPVQPHRPFRKQPLLNNRPIRHPRHMPEARKPRSIEDLHGLGHPSRRAHLSWHVEGAIQPPAPAGDPAQSVEKRWDDADAIQHGPRTHAACASQCWQEVLKTCPAAARRLCMWGFCNGSPAVIRPR
eukprot:365347-Chlamydomonas_euryale.AAC.29